MKRLLILLIFSIPTFAALDTAVIPNIFVPLTPATAADANDNFDSLKTALNRIIDSLNNKFTRYTDFDSTDTNFNKIFIDTINAIDGRFATCSTGVGKFATANIYSGTADLSACTTGALIANNATIDTIHNTDSAYFNKAYVDTLKINNELDLTFTTINCDSIQTVGGASFGGGVTSTTLNTGQGDNELYDMDQNVLTTSDAAFDSVYTANGVSFGGSVKTAEIASLSTPISGYGNYGVLTDGLPYFKNDSGEVYTLAPKRKTWVCDSIVGADSSGEHTFYYEIKDSVVTLMMPEINVVGDFSIFFTGLLNPPSEIRPNTTHRVPITGLKGTAYEPGYIIIDNSNLWTAFLHGTIWAGGDRGFGAQIIQYRLF